MDHPMLAHQRCFRNLRTIRHRAGIAPFDLCALHQCLLLGLLRHLVQRNEMSAVGG
jgi:hypothetical protein